MRIRSCRFVLVMAMGAAAGGCVASPGDGPPPKDASIDNPTATGGATASGGNPGTGGATSTGGMIATGGAVATGGNVSTGGTVASGGSGSGGSLGSGGTTGSSGGSQASSGGTQGGSGGSAGGRGGRGGATASSGGASGLGGKGTGEGCMAPTRYPNLFVTLSGHTQEETDAKVAKAWTSLFNPAGTGNIYFDGPGSDESYVTDILNKDVRTEGMSYGMMTAVQLNHQTEFDRLWTWVKKHMANGTGEIAWSCSTTGTKNSNGGAPDGEEYMATALIFANKRWGTTGKYDYAKEAQWVLDLIRTKYINASNHIVKFVSNSSNTDASYILPAFYQAWACFDTANAAFWNSTVTAGRQFFPKAIDGNGVIGDQSSFTGQTAKAAGPDTIRCVMNIMMDHNFFNADPWQTETYATKYGGYMASQNPGVAQMSCNALLGFGLPAATGKPFVDKLWAANVPSRDYWNGVLYMLGLLHVSGTFHLWY